MTDIDLDDRISEMLAECELALRGKSYGGWCEVRYPATDIARLIRMLKRRTEALHDIAGGFNYSKSVDGAIMSGDKIAFKEAFCTWMQEHARAALAYQGEPDA